MDDYDEKDTLPVHLILGASEYVKIPTNENLHVGNTGEPVAEHTRFGWVLMSPGEDGVGTLGCLAINFTTNYDNLSALDVLGLADNAGKETKELEFWVNLKDSLLDLTKDGTKQHSRVNQIIHPS